MERWSGWLAGVAVSDALLITYEALIKNYHATVKLKLHKNQWTKRATLIAVWRSELGNASRGASGQGGGRAPDHALRAGVRGVRAACARAPPRQYRRDARQSRRRGRALHGEYKMESERNEELPQPRRVERRNWNSARSCTLHKCNALARKLIHFHVK